MPTHSSEAPHPVQHRHPTVLSPDLQRDVRRLRRMLPLLLLLIPAAAILGAAYFSAGMLIGPQEAWQKPFGKPRRFGLTPRTVRFTSEDGVQLSAWWERPWTVVNSKATVILVHGSQMNKTGMAFAAGMLVPRGYNVLVPDLRAHGESGGHYGTFGYKEALDVLAAIRWVRQQGNREPIALLGYSSGAVAALHAAAQSPDVSVVIADSAYGSVSDVLDREASYLRHPAPNVTVPLAHRLRLWLFTSPGIGGLGRWMFRLRSGVAFDPPEWDLTGAVRKIAKARVLYLTADQDPVVPLAATERLFAATATPDKQLIVLPGKFHSAMAGDPRRYIETVTDFLGKAVPGNR